MEEPTLWYQPEGQFSRQTCLIHNEALCASCASIQPWATTPAPLVPEVEPVTPLPDAVRWDANSIWYQPVGSRTPKCRAHDKRICGECRQIINPDVELGPWIAMPKAPSQPRQPRQRLSAVGERSANGLACPKCGGTQFTAKRSKKGKAIGFATIGVAGLIAPKTMVKCVPCGAMYKRG